MDDIELFKRYNSKGREIAGLDLESEEDYKQWYESNSSFHCMDVAYARTYLGFRGEEINPIIIPGKTARSSLKIWTSLLNGLNHS